MSDNKKQNILQSVVYYLDRCALARPNLSNRQRQMPEAFKKSNSAKNNSSSVFHFSHVPNIISEEGLKILLADKDVQMYRKNDNKNGYISEEGCKINYICLLSSGL